MDDPYTVKAQSGDSAAKQILLHLDSQRTGNYKFISADIDETHLLVRTEAVEEIKAALQEELEKNTYVKVKD
ncbi:hypothetical protein A1Q1_00466 [Trichosporon asahii var. asahii CBS 2479]|uniref:General transcription and DNA repair factor IIH subunit TFB5 n=1 Tax=Trichosporon asahii var. asahii (strain ATCC 90039 / CBS 2479 / JCM 2466 / KCTC 7840 / NBRC 103889/ NCYC 2677 / UAMH 7654) TaxID=1186058 RepID=J6F4S0_TRIAS|nr:hypothetical protein A1Q1_00466 [Trichosporon asahii var. asahii CBS 2479]EJT50272.1 hypothetical protein A1Q1_00466 [Trichosporon asahii var. asahii CBS 2479]